MTFEEVKFGEEFYTCRMPEFKYINLVHFSLGNQMMGSCLEVFQHDFKYNLFLRHGKLDIEVQLTGRRLIHLRKVKRLIFKLLVKNLKGYYPDSFERLKVIYQLDPSLFTLGE